MHPLRQRNVLRLHVEIGGVVVALAADAGGLDAVFAQLASLIAPPLPRRLADLASSANVSSKNRQIARQLSDQRPTLSDTYKGAIDCDIHPRVPTPRAV